MSEFGNAPGDPEEAVTGRKPEARRTRWRDPSVLTIGVLTEQLQVSPRTIRFYEERGLIAPVRDGLNRRIFDAESRGTLVTIRRLRDAGLGMKEVEGLLAGRASPDWRAQVVAQLEARRAATLLQLRAVNEALESL